MWEWLKGKVAPLTAAGAIGSRGERRAERYLTRVHGYQVIARNWRSPLDQRDELDLVCRDGNVLVFVEVKSRAPGALVSGYHAVDTRKKKALRRGADAYLKALPPSARPHSFRLDIVEVCSSPAPDDSDLRHFENVPLFPKHYWP